MSVLQSAHAWAMLHPLQCCGGLHGPEPGAPCTPSPRTPPADVLVPGMAKVNSAGAHGHSEGSFNLMKCEAFYGLLIT